MGAFAKLPQVKLIVLDKVETLRRQHGLQDSLTMEVLRILASPDLDVRKKALGIALELVRTARSPAFPRGAFWCFFSGLKQEYRRSVTSTQKRIGGKVNLGDSAKIWLKV
jgi:hypothetical protein